MPYAHFHLQAQSVLPHTPLQQVGQEQRLRLQLQVLPQCCTFRAKQKMGRTILTSSNQAAFSHFSLWLCVVTHGLKICIGNSLLLASTRVVTVRALGFGKELMSTWHVREHGRLETDRQLTGDLCKRPPGWNVEHLRGLGLQLVPTAELEELRCTLLDLPIENVLCLRRQVIHQLFIRKQHNLADAFACKAQARQEHFLHSEGSMARTDGVTCCQHGLVKLLG